MKYTDKPKKGKKAAVSGAKTDNFASKNSAYTKLMKKGGVKCKGKKY